jgi:hypothetical protein
MTVSKAVVTLVGLVAIVWVLWYFLATPRPARGPGGRR